MRRTALLAAIAIGLALLAPVPVLALSEAQHAAIAKTSVERHILPRYQALAEAGSPLAAAAERYCASRNPETLSALRAAFGTFLDRWAAIRHIQFGPVLYSDRTHRLQFWPDSRNQIGRQLDRLVASGEASRLAPESFAATSIAVQGLPALERLIFPDDGGPTVTEGPDGAFACSVVRAIADNLAAIAADTLSDWRKAGGYADQIAAAGTGKGPFQEASEVSVALLQSLSSEIEASRDVRLGRPLGSAPGRQNPKLAEAWRSEKSADILRATVAAAEHLYRQGGFAEALEKTGNSALAKRISDRFGAVSAGIDHIGPSLETALGDPAHRPRIEALQKALAGLRQTISTDLAVALEISPGFNSRDGD